MLKKYLKRIVQHASTASVPLAQSSTLYDRTGARKLDTPQINSLSDDELERLNSLLPWAAYTIDKSGRRFGQPYSTTKRNTPQDIPDRRIVELHRRFNLKGKRVLEAGCFEGIHTTALAQFGANVAAFDGRIENVVKTLVRCWAFSTIAEIFFWDAETKAPASRNLECDILHHVGVLYHLMDPIGHLQEILPFVREAIMLDTHIAPDQDLLSDITNNFEYRYFNFKESGRDAPFAGLGDHAKWITLEDLIMLFNVSGFSFVDVAERREERNGPRVLIYASRNNHLND